MKPFKLILAMLVAIAFNTSVIAADANQVCLDMAAEENVSNDKTAGACSCLAEKLASDDAAMENFVSAKDIPAGPDREASYTAETKALFDQCGPWT